MVLEKFYEHQSIAVHVLSIYAGKPVEEPNFGQPKAGFESHTGPNYNPDAELELIKRRYREGKEKQSGK